MENKTPKTVTRTIRNLIEKLAQAHNPRAEYFNACESLAGVCPAMTDHVVWVAKAIATQTSGPDPVGAGIPGYDIYGYATDDRGREAPLRRQPEWRTKYLLALHALLSIRVSIGLDSHMFVLPDWRHGHKKVEMFGSAAGRMCDRELCI